VKVPHLENHLTESLDVVPMSRKSDVIFNEFLHGLVIRGFFLRRQHVEEVEGVMRRLSRRGPKAVAAKGKGKVQRRKGGKLGYKSVGGEKLRVVRCVRSRSCKYGSVSSDRDKLRDRQWRLCSVIL
jgi:hypothetical protein